MTETDPRAARIEAEEALHAREQEHSEMVAKIVAQEAERAQPRAIPPRPAASPSWPLCSR